MRCKPAGAAADGAAAGTSTTTAVVSPGDARYAERVLQAAGVPQGADRGGSGSADLMTRVNEALDEAAPELKTLMVRPLFSSACRPTWLPEILSPGESDVHHMPWHCTASRTAVNHRVPAHPGVVLHSRTAEGDVLTGMA